MSKQKKYHYIYKTTCTVTGKFYVGMHSTDNLEDGYLGSGKILGYSRKKYGDENHVREILEMLPSREALKAREKEIVNEALLADPLNINLKYGGDGGGRLWNEEHRQKFVNSSRTKNYAGTALARSWSRKAASTRNARGTQSRKTPDWSNKTHSDITKLKMSLSMKNRYDGENNPSYGSRWVTNGTPIKIKKEQLEQYLSNGYRLGRK